MRFLGLAGLAGACLATSPLYAADLFDSAPPPMDAPSFQSELGSNWYIRGDVGYGSVKEDTIQSTPYLFPTVRQGGFIANNTFNPVAGAAFNDAPVGSPGSNTAIVRGQAQSTTVPSFDVGFGYRINDWLRTEATYSAFRGPSLGTSGQAKCVTGYTPASNLNTTTNTYDLVGYTATTSDCTGFLNAHQFNQTVMAAAYIDLGHWKWFNPFVGAGVGVNANYITGSLNWYDSTTGAAYGGPPAVSAPYTTMVPSGQLDQNGNAIYVQRTDAQGKTGTGLYNPQSWNRNFTAWRYSLAGMVAAGVGIPISQSATLDIAWKATALDLSAGMRNVMQTGTIGVRYNIN